MAKWGRWFPISSTALKAQPITAGVKCRTSLQARKPVSGKLQERELESIWGHALFTCIATALRPSQRKGLRFHQCRLVSNLLLMATLHPILFPDLLDSIIVSIIKAISSKVWTNEENISKHGASGCCSLLEALRYGFNYTNHAQDYSNTKQNFFFNVKLGGGVTHTEIQSKTWNLSKNHLSCQWKN